MSAAVANPSLQISLVLSELTMLPAQVLSDLATYGSLVVLGYMEGMGRDLLPDYTQSPMTQQWMESAWTALWERGKFIIQSKVPQ